MKKLSAILLSLSILPTVSACTVKATHDASGDTTGYYVAKDERSPGQIAQDAALTAKVKTKLGVDQMVPAMAIDVDTYLNVVTLTGNVRSQAVAQRAIDIARAADGVRAVRSRLTVVPY